MTRKPMDPFARKMWQGSFVYGGIMLVMFAVLTGCLPAHAPTLL